MLTDVFGEIGVPDSRSLEATHPCNPARLRDWQARREAGQGANMNRFALALAIGLLMLGWGCGGSSTSVTNPPPPPPTASPDVRADYLVSQMTQGEKVQLVHGGVTVSNPVTPLGAAGWVPEFLG